MLQRFSILFFVGLLATNFFLFSTFLIAQNIDNVANYAEKGKQALEQNQFEQALANYAMALQTEPANTDYMYGAAMANYRLKNYTEASQICEKIIANYHFDSKYYRLLANSYDLLGQYPKALETLAQGMKMNKYDGALHFDLGIIELERGNMQAAIAAFENGIAAQPVWADNYYMAAKLYADSNEPFWALAYAEIFINLERSTERWEEMTNLLFNTYIKCFNPDAENQQKQASIQLQNRPPNSFANLYQSIWKIMQKNGLLNLQIATLNNTDTATIAKNLTNIIEIRKTFFDLWKQIAPIELANPLFDYHKTLNDYSYFEAYTHWIFSKTAPGPFFSFQSKNYEKYMRYIEWYIGNPIKINFTNYFVRMNFEAK